MIVSKTSVFPASVSEVFTKLQKPETLRIIADPYLSFEPIGEGEIMWKADTLSSYRIKLFGSISLGIHTIRIIRFDPDRIKSLESNDQVPVWNHDITLVRLDESHTQYTDTVEIHAGWKTFFIWLWANAFYSYRQRK